MRLKVRDGQRLERGATAPIEGFAAKLKLNKGTKSHWQRGGYTPHQGERECARRRRQLEKARAKAAAH